MTREEAIEIIKIARAEVEWEYPMDYAAAFDKAIEALEQEPKWIPVSEGLPEYGTEVLTCIRSGYVEIQSLETYGEYWENQHGDWTDFDEVIAWLLLPKPYRAESEE